MEGDIQIACRPAIYTRSALSSQLDGLSVGDTSRDGDTQVFAVYGDDLLVWLCLPLPPMPPNICSKKSENSLPSPELLQ